MASLIFKKSVVCLMDFRGSSPEFAVVKEPKQIGSQVTRNFRASKEKKKLYCKLMGNSRLGLTLLAEN